LLEDGGLRDFLGNCLLVASADEVGVGPVEGFTGRGVEDESVLTFGVEFELAGDDPALLALAELVGAVGVIDTAVAEGEVEFVEVEPAIKFGLEGWDRGSGFGGG